VPDIDISAIFDSHRTIRYRFPVLFEQRRLLRESLGDEHSGFECTPMMLRFWLEYTAFLPTRILTLRFCIFSLQSLPG